MIEKDSKPTVEPSKSDKPVEAGKSEAGTEAAVETAPAEPVKLYRLKKDAKSHGVGLRQKLQPGKVILLTQRQAKAFSDKFEAVDDTDFHVPTPADHKQVAKLNA
jgi:hypothetical protein